MMKRWMAENMAVRFGFFGRGGVVFKAERHEHE
jgi:hypothetical protein